MTTLTAAEREAALRQVTAMDTMNSVLSMCEGDSARKRVPIIRNGNEIWVAVDPITNTVSADVPQPDPGRQVLCSGEGIYENTYCYADQLPISIICTLIFAVVSALVFTPLSLLCCIPMLQHLRKAEHDAERNDMESARKNCNRYCCLYVGASVWIAIAFVLYIILAVAFGIFIHA